MGPEGSLTRLKGLASMSGCRGFKAKVFSGVGEGEFYVSLYAKRFREELGITPYPGTLNTRLIERVEEFNECLEKMGGRVIEPPRIPGARLGRVRVYKASVNGHPVYIVRPEITVYDKSVAELIAEEYLRDLLNVKDGDIVVIDVEEG